ncbi:hypothetical protein BDN72DRAFT_899390 [Pluteus cervinus]|uniref:Uncharacterized protein n=1 Tax=Pluteus cervinus TaxID=181527 RepID=A0ACD3AN53_9AGAR|nr:hypothetical protein BDN72DRAFT_899390 [Pluteus cervinus]
MGPAFLSNKARSASQRKHETQIASVFIAISQPLLGVVKSSSTDPFVEVFTDVRNDLSSFTPASASSWSVGGLLRGLSRSRSRSRKHRSRSPLAPVQVRSEPEPCEDSWVHIEEEVPSIIIEDPTGCTHQQPPDGNSSTYQTCSCGRTSSRSRLRAGYTKLRKSLSREALRIRTRVDADDVPIRDNETDERPRGRSIGTRGRSEGSILTPTYNLKAEKEKLLNAIWKNTKGVVHGTLETGVDLLDFVPIPGVKGLVQTILNIWNAFENVDSNRGECIDLIRRCTDILCSLEKLKEMGSEAAEHSAVPFERLSKAFTSVESFVRSLQAQNAASRLLKHKNHSEKLQKCKEQLHDAFQEFQVCSSLDNKLPLLS